MKKIIERYLIDIITNQKTSIIEKEKSIKLFFEKILKLNKPENDRTYKIYDIKIIWLIYWFYRKDEMTLYKPITEISEDIEEIIKYNEDMVVFTKYI